ncbi:MAG: polysaccharide deacetylase family protein [Spirochaetales bacterium]|nr:polysaccharide deacetylase family protein [Spirochaetales bacterium]
MNRQVTGLLFLCIVLSVPGLNAFSEVTYGDLNLHSSDMLLFSAATSSPVFGEYSTLFEAGLSAKTLDQLTFFPEKIMLIDQDNMYQIQNRFGVFRSDKDLRNMRIIQQFPAFVHGQDVQTGKINTVGSSTNGSYLLYLKERSHGYADLVLYSIAQSREILVSQQVELTLDGPNALWAPDSNYFVYAKGGSLYYYSIPQLLNERVVAEEFRRIGTGAITSIQWSNQNDLYYIRGSLVYKIVSPQFFTRSLYSGLLEVGDIVGKIPFVFDPAFDSFYISPDGTKLLLNKGGSNIFFYFLKADDYLSTGETISLPYLYLPRNTTIKKVVWARSDMITILTGSLEEGLETSRLYRLDASTIEAQKSYAAFETPGVMDIQLSPDNSRLALLYGSRVDIYDYFLWKEYKSFEVLDPLHSMWRGDDELIIAGRHRSYTLNVNTGQQSLICLSSYVNAGFTRTGKVEIATRDGIYLHDGTLSPKEEMEGNPVVQASRNYRVYLEPYAGGNYTNMVMVRDIGKLGTTPLFYFPSKNYEPFPDTDEAVDFDNFTHGSRIRRREVSLVFNAIDSVEGLTSILYTLKEFGIRATFFINGDFIRRNPEAVRELSLSGHEIGSLFYTYYNMTDARFKVDKNFIKQGLAHNEDDYHAATGKEISLYWHAPYYFVNSDIIQAGKEMNYVYVGRDVDTLDWVSPGALQSAQVILSAAELVERVIKLKKPGSIIPVRIGKTEPERSDYLFQKLDVLINSLLSLGYRLVPVSELMEHAK